MTKSELNERLQSINLYENIGHPCAGMISAKSWKDAQKQNQKRLWGDFLNEIDNRRSELVFRAMGDGGMKWNDRVHALNPAIDHATKDLVERSSIGEIPSFAKQELSASIQSMFIEAEFSELSPPLFAIPLELKVLEAGHFLCGWKGRKLKECWEGTSLDDLPEGQFVIY